MQEKLKFHVEQTTSGEIIYREDQTMLGAMPETLIFKTRKELAEYIYQGDVGSRIEQYVSQTLEQEERSRVRVKELNDACDKAHIEKYGSPQVTAPATSAEDSHSKSKAWINEIDKAYGDHPKMNINAANAANTAGLASKQLNMQNSAFNANDYYPHNLPKRCNDGTVFKSKEDSKPPVKPEIAAMAEFAVKCGYGGRFKEFSLALAGIGYLADECLKEQANPQGDKE